jgi:hypothetical protein
MKATTMIITPFDAMWREIGCLYRALEHARAAIETAVEGVDDRALHARPVAGGPSIASLLLGFGSEEATWIHRRWRQEASPPHWVPFLGKPATHGLAAIVAWLREVREATRLALMKATDADLDRKTIETDEERASLRWVLHRLLDQAAYARGQIALLRPVLSSKGTP